MTGNVILNGKKRRLDYGVAVSTLFIFFHVIVSFCLQ